MREVYRKQIRLLLEVLPLLSKFEDFALKGGTAINFFVRDFPRLSVDIDLTYLPVKDRMESLNGIRSGLEQLNYEIGSRLRNVKTTPIESGGILNKLLIRSEDAQIKLEVNHVLRGSIFDPVEMTLTPRLQQQFEYFVEVKTLSFADLYGGKICAALDRQHPRDLYDIHYLLKNEGLTDQIRLAFIGYLISHPRPISELLNPNVVPIDDIYHKEFEGMIDEVNILDELVEVQQMLPQLILSGFTESEKKFLISFKKGSPEWGLIPLPHLQKLPGVQWKLSNIHKMDIHKHTSSLAKLEKLLR